MFFPRIALVLLLVAPAAAIDRTPRTDDLIAHEWGTLTSVAGEAGNPVQWTALLGPADLPCFVERLSQLSPKFSSAYVRMETPVIYFYSPRPVTLSVGVKFPHGWITEWYPRASAVKPKSTGIPLPAGTAIDNRLWVYGRGEIRWDAVNVLPGPDPEYPRGKEASPYYAARHTDSAPLRVGKQQEKLIFYRGIGNFQVPLRAAYAAGGGLEIRNASDETIPLAILFENQDGKIGYRKVTGLSGTVRLDMPELTANLTGLRRELVQYLVEFGLYLPEAEAMLETWSDSWFEEGTRVIDIMPRPVVDSFLPLDIEPVPASIARVFVGRVELLSPWMRQRIEAATGARDIAGLQKFGRFLTAFAAQIQGASSSQPGPIQEATGKLFKKQFEDPGCVQ